MEHLHPARLVRRFWQLGLRHLPDQTRRLGSSARSEPAPGELRELYEQLAAADLAREVLQRAQGQRLRGTGFAAGVQNL